MTGVSPGNNEFTKEGIAFVLFVLITSLVSLGIYYINIATCSYNIYGISVNNENISLSVLVYCAFVFLLLVYATSI